MSAEPEKKAAGNMAELPIPRAASPVHVVGTRGVFYSIHQGGKALKKHRGAWVIELKNGKRATLRSAGWVPGFQKLYLDGELIYSFGLEAPLAAKILSFLPLGLIALNSLVGGILGIVLVFYNLYTIKNPDFPNRVKVILPVLNTIAGVLVVIVITGSGNAS